MGRHLFWRKIVILFVFTCLFCCNLFSLPAWLETKKKGLPTAALHVKARQGHAGPQVFTIDIPHNDAVMREIKIYDIPYNREQLSAILLRGRLYRSFILSRLKALHLPPELYFVALIESQYEVRAVSPAGAVGLWQLMDYSAVGQGLAIDEWRDERRDFWKSTEGALAILANNYLYYKDWLLALAAYNAGRGAVDNAIGVGKTRDFFILAGQNLLPEETKRFVPKILAVCLIGTYPGRYQLPVSWEHDPSWTRVAIRVPVDIRSLAEAACVPIEMLKEAHSELNYGVTPPEPGYFLKVPIEHQAALVRALLSPQEQLIRNSLYTVRSGDTFYSLARHFQVTQSMLLAYNGAFLPSKLPVGAKLVIPHKKEDMPPPPYREPFTGKAFTSAYTVKAGDTLFSIAKRHLVPVEELCNNNRLTLEAVIHPGDTLNVPPSFTDE